MLLNAKIKRHLMEARKAGPQVGDYLELQRDCKNSSNAPWTSEIIARKGNKFKVKHDGGYKWYDVPISELNNPYVSDNGDTIFRLESTTTSDLAIKPGSGFGFGTDKLNREKDKLLKKRKKQLDKDTIKQYTGELLNNSPESIVESYFNG